MSSPTNTVFNWFSDSQVSCIFMERCILPCSFHGSSEPVVHWFKTEGNLRVHSYYGDQDQLVIQHQRFRSRTSLFKDQVYRGNASLQLTEVNVQDEGRYQCYTSTISGNTEMFIILNVDGNKTLFKKRGKTKAATFTAYARNWTTNILNPYY